MRKVDRWAGVPCCLFMTLLRKLVSLVWKRKPAGPPKRILFIELAETGALVVAYPAMAHARRLFPDAEIYFMSFALGSEMLPLLGVDQEHQIIIRPNGLWRFAVDTLKALRRVRKLKIDACVNLECFARFSTLLAFFSGAPRRAGYGRFYDEGRYVGDLVTHKNIYTPHVHAAVGYIGLVQSLSEEPDKEPRSKQSLHGVSLALPRVESGVPARKAVLAEIRAQYPDFRDSQRIVLLNSNAGDLVLTRRWPEEHFIALAQGLLREPDVLIAFTGAPDERESAENLRQRLDSERVLNMAGRTTLPGLMDLYNVSDLLITNDSGPAHFASLTDIPVIVLFGPETPRIFGPLGDSVDAVYLGLSCSPCVAVYNQKRSPCTDNQCLKQITPESVLNKALAVLSEKRGKEAYKIIA